MEQEEKEVDKKKADEKRGVFKARYNSTVGSLSF